MTIGEAIESKFHEMTMKFLRPVDHADNVVNCPPEWVRASGAEYFFGIKRDYLNGLVIEGKVTAKKPDKIVLYKYAEIKTAIDNMKSFKPNKENN